MEKTVYIDGKPVVLRVSGGTLCRYKQQFGSEYLSDYRKINCTKGTERIKALETAGFRLVWALAKTADSSVPEPSEWLKGFNDFKLSEIITEAFSLIDMSLACVKDSGGSDGREFTSENLVAGCLACGLSYEDIDSMPIGFLMNVIGEYCRIRTGKSKDKVVYRKATKADYDSF